MDSNYRDLFFAESEEYLKEINKALVELEKEPQSVEAINLIFRIMHTLKGMSATMGYEELAWVAHRLEDFFDVLRSGQGVISTQMMDVIFEGIDCLATLLGDVRENRASLVDTSLWSRKLDSIMPQDRRKEVFKEEEDKSPQKNFFEVVKERKTKIFRIKIYLREDCPMKGVRAFLVVVRAKNIGVAVKSLPPEEILRREEFGNSFELILATDKDKASVAKELFKISEIEDIKIDPIDVESLKSFAKKDVSSLSPYLKKIQSMRIPVGRLDMIMNLIGELAIAKDRLLQTMQRNDPIGLDQATSLIERLVSSLQDETLKMRLLPMSYILDNFPRIVRDLARKSGKEVDFEIVGGQIELDRVILDEIGELLVHIIRNAIDHGLESPAERQKADKPLHGKIILKVFREKGYIIIEISDDGRGIDLDKVVKKAYELGIIPGNEAANVDAKRILDLLVIPGFSTHSKATDVSGRGVGLDVVKIKLVSLGGRLDMETEVGRGTKFIFTLPLTLAIVKAMLVTIGNQIYAIPLMNIRETLKIAKSEVKIIKDIEVIRVRDEIISLLRLHHLFGIETSLPENEDLSVVIVEGRSHNLGLVVDSVIGEQDIVVKPLSSPLKKIKGVAGATILGDGRVALILDVVNIQ